MRLTDEIQAEVGRVILGKQEVIHHVLLAMLAGGHVLLEDVPGVGKTTLAMAFSKVLGLSTRRVQFTSDTLPSDILGFSVYDAKQGAMSYRPGAVMTNLLLADEINRTSSKTQSALLEAMEERQVTLDGQTHALPQPFLVLATQNPVGSAGTQMLPASQLDRFLLRLSMGYPDHESQIALLKDRSGQNPLDAVRPLLDAPQLLEVCAQAMQVYVADPVYDYIVRLCEATRSEEDVLLGLSPRGMLALCRAARAQAFLDGRDYVIPQDAAQLLPLVAGHRLVMGAKARLHEKTPQRVLEEILAKVPAPTGRTFCR